jgi:hypothetical protein
MDLRQFHKSLPVLKQPARHDKRNLMFAKYTQALAAAPEAYSLPNIPSVTPTYYGNDLYGDCTKAAYAGMVYSLSTAAGSSFNYTDAQVEQMYSECDGFDPAKPKTDNGSDGLTTLKYLQKSGAFGHAPVAYLALQLGNAEEMRLGARYFGGLYMGVALPKAWQGETTWDASPFGLTSGKWAPWSWGGHMIYGKARYTPDYLEFLSWKTTYKITWKALNIYPDELYCVIVPDFVSPDGFDSAKLQADLVTMQ